MNKQSKQSLNRNLEDLYGLIIRPQRSNYELHHLGPTLFRIENRLYERGDVVVENPRGLRLQCSLFQPVEAHRVAQRLPVVVYCHGNCGSRQDSLDCVMCLLPHNIMVCAFDFAGCGMSDGEFVSLGFYERQDLAAVIEYLNTLETVGPIGLWGRSMGAVTSIMYGSKDPEISAIVADSPFSSLQEVVLDLVTGQRGWIPKLFVKGALQVLRQGIMTRAHFDIRDLDTIAASRSCSVPIIFGHATSDELVPLKHTEQVHEAYKGEKKLVTFPGDHNAERPDSFMLEVALFFVKHLLLSREETNRIVPKATVDAIFRLDGVEFLGGDDEEADSSADVRDIDDVHPVLEQ